MSRKIFTLKFLKISRSETFKMHNPDWRIIKTNYICIGVCFWLQKYHMMQKSTFSITVQYHFKISVLQHWWNVIFSTFIKKKMWNGICLLFFEYFSAFMLCFENNLLNRKIFYFMIKSIIYSTTNMIQKESPIFNSYKDIWGENINVYGMLFTVLKN